MWIGISLGDVTGVGPEVTLKALASEAGQGDERYLILGDEGYLRRVNEKLGLGLKWQTFGKLGDGRLFVGNPLPEPLASDLVAGSPAAARAAVASLRDGA